MTATTTLFFTLAFAAWSCICVIAGRLLQQHYDKDNAK